MCNNTQVNPAYMLIKTRRHYFSSAEFFFDIKIWAIHNIFLEKKGHFRKYHVYLFYDKWRKAHENSKNCNM